MIRVRISHSIFSHSITSTDRMGNSKIFSHSVFSHSVFIKEPTVLYYNISLLVSQYRNT